jgi:hypothetical protein
VCRLPKMLLSHDPIPRPALHLILWKFCSSEDNVHGFFAKVLGSGFWGGVQRRSQPLAQHDECTVHTSIGDLLRPPKSQRVGVGRGEILNFYK